MTKSLNLLQRLEASCGPVSLTDNDHHLLDSELDDLLRSIAKCASVEAAGSFLLELGELEDVLVTLLCKHEVRLTERQREIVTEYDRWDVPEVRQEAYRKIKNGEPPWHERPVARQKWGQNF